jgi:meso-butanediol dehydrogenase / (S,S)-butanediol dehydrogenase / diacetyl reductase
VGLPHAMFSLYQSSKAALERFTEALHAELEPHGIRVTMVRAGQMMHEDSKSPATGELARRFAEENLKRGLDLRARPISSFSSVAYAALSQEMKPSPVPYFCDRRLR